MAESVNQIFISYRREDSAAITGRIYDRLVQKFGREAVFKDVDSMPIGVNFRKRLDAIVSECAVVLVVIGDRWVERLDDSRDFVRIEVESALRRDIPVVPLLVQDALLPPEESLPESLRELVDRNGLTIGHDPHFHGDITRLITSLEAILTAEPVTKRPPPDALPHSPQPVGAGTADEQKSAKEVASPPAAPVTSPVRPDNFRHAPELRAGYEAPANTKLELYVSAVLLGTLAPSILGVAFAYATEATVHNYISGFNPTDAYPSILLVGEMCAAYTLLVIGFAIGFRTRRDDLKMALLVSAFPFAVNMAGALHYLTKEKIYLNHFFFSYTAVFMTPMMPLLAYLGLRLGTLYVSHLLVSAIGDFLRDILGGYRH